jgi:hypothetical protein
MQCSLHQFPMPEDSTLWYVDRLPHYSYSCANRLTPLCATFTLIACPCRAESQHGFDPKTIGMTESDAGKIALVFGQVRGRPIGFCKACQLQRSSRHRQALCMASVTLQGVSCLRMVELRYVFTGMVCSLQAPVCQCAEGVS